MIEGKTLLKRGLYINYFFFKRTEREGGFYSVNIMNIELILFVDED
jgi:hypothetical protein